MRMKTKIYNFVVKIEIHYRSNSEREKNIGTITPEHFGAIS